MSGSPRRHDEAPARWHAPRPENYRHTLTCVAYRAAPLAAPAALLALLLLAAVLVVGGRA